MIVEDFDFHAAGSRPNSPQPEDVAKNGTAEDIARLTRHIDIHSKDMADFGTIVTAAATARQEPWRLHAYLGALTGRLPDTGTERNNIIHARIASPMVVLLAAMPHTLDDLLACLPAHLRDITLDRMLRVAANQGHNACLPLLVAAGANPQSDQSRCLLNALLREHTSCAATLRTLGAETEQALTLLAGMNMGAETHKKVSSQLIKTALLTQAPADFYYATLMDTEDGYKDRIPLRDQAVALFRQGQHGPLQQFLRGYLFFKRDHERKRKADDGYNALVIAPVNNLMDAADDPAHSLSHMLAVLPPRDRETATGLILRAACINGQSPLLADAIIANGANVAMHGNLALSLAVRHGHTELALHLVRRHDAQIGEAVLDAQINGVDAAQMQKLYSFMAAQMMQAPAPAMPVRLHKPAGTGAKP